MSDLRRELEELKRQVEALMPSTAAEDYLAQVVFRDPKFAPHLAEIIAALCGAAPTYSFIIAADPEEGGHPMRYTALWYDRASAPIVIQYTRRWREMRFGEQLTEPASYDQQNEPPAQAVTVLARSSYQMERAEQMMNDTLARAETSESRPTSAQGHSEQPATAADSAAIQAKIEQLQARIAQLTAEEQRQEQTAAHPTPVVSPPSASGEAASDWTRRVF